MNKEEEQRIAARYAKMMAVLCVRATQIELLRAGKTPLTKTGDYSDVFVLEADGNRIPWTNVSRLNDAEMQCLSREITNRLYTFQLERDNPRLQFQLVQWVLSMAKLEEPRLDGRILRSP